MGRHWTPRRITISPREWDTMRLILEGKQDKEIAALQGCCPQTVKNRIRILRSKFYAFGVGSRIELGLLYLLKQQKPPRQEKGYPGSILAAIAELEADD